MTATPPRRAHLRQVDVLRLLTCLCVVTLHVVSNTNPVDSTGANAVAVLLHHSRPVFFFVTSLVLVHSSLDGARDRNWGAFLRKRATTIGVPYLVWTVLYVPLDGRPVGYVGPALLFGTGWYHLYFLLVNLQFSLLLPGFVRLLAATRRWHGVLLAASFAVQLATLAFYHQVWAPQDWYRPLIGESSLLAYQFWLVAGGVVAMNLHACERWLARLRVAVPLVAVGAAVGCEAWYRHELRHGVAGSGAAHSLQPMTALWTVAVLPTLYLLCLWWTGRRHGPRTTAVVDAGVRLSFGLYLIHPVVLYALWRLAVLLPVGAPSLPVTVVVAVLTLALSLGAAALLGRTPLSLPFTGRPRPRAPLPALQPA